MCAPLSPTAWPQGVGKDIEVPIIEDLRERFIIDSLALYVLRDGCAIEQVCRRACWRVCVCVLLVGGCVCAYVPALPQIGTPRVLAGSPPNKRMG